jgi:hypothetical protein
VLTQLSEIVAAIGRLDQGDLPAVAMALAARLAATRPPEKQPQSNGPRLVDVAALAAALNYPKSWLMSQARQGRIPSVRQGKYVRFNIAAVEAALRRD